MNIQMRKWLGLPRCLSSIGLYGNGALSLPISSLVEEYKCAKSRLGMTLTESWDPFVSGAAPTLATGRKWKPSAAVTVAWEQQHPHGKRLPQPSGGTWWWRKCAARRKQPGVPKQSPKLSKAAG